MTWRDGCFCGCYVGCAADSRTAPPPAVETGMHHHLPSRMAEVIWEWLLTTSDGRGIGEGGISTEEVRDATKDRDCVVVVACTWDSRRPDRITIGRDSRAMAHGVVLSCPGLVVLLSDPSH